MKLLLCGEFGTDERVRWQRALAAALPEARWLDDADARDRPDAVQAAVVANPPPGSLQGLPRRMVDPAMNAAMAETALWAVLSLHRGFFEYARRQRDAHWQVHRQRRANEVNVLVLGQGQMGRAVAARLLQQGYTVMGWRRDGAPLPPLLGRAHIVINLLPLTADTHGLLDAAFFAALPPEAAVVNLARGAHVVDDDLLAALDNGRLHHAVLDVFHAEPLPRGHPYWHHPRVTVLPHAAAITDPRSAATVAAANLRAALAGQPVAHLVDRARGY